MERLRGIGRRVKRRSPQAFASTRRGSCRARAVPRRFRRGRGAFSVPPALPPGPRCIRCSLPVRCSPSASARAAWPARPPEAMGTGFSVPPPHRSYPNSPPNRGQSSLSPSPPGSHLPSCRHVHPAACITAVGTRFPQVMPERAQRATKPISDPRPRPHRVSASHAVHRFSSANLSRRLFSYPGCSAHWRRYAAPAQASRELAGEKPVNSASHGARIWNCANPPQPRQAASLPRCRPIRPSAGVVSMAVAA